MKAKNNPHKCKYCFIEFNNKNKLDRHYNRMKKCYERKFSIGLLDCTYCNNTYSTQCNLRRHELTCPIRNNNKLLIRQLNKLKKRMRKYQNIDQN